MAKGNDDTYTNLINLEEEVKELVNAQQTLQHLTQQTLQKFTQTPGNSYRPVMSTPYTGYDPSDPFTYGHLSTIQETPPYRSPVPPRTNTPPAMATPYNAQDTSDPFSYEHLDTIQGTSQYRPPVPPRTTQTDTTPQTSTFPSTVPLTPIKVTSAQPTSSHVIPLLTQFSTSVPHPVAGTAYPTSHTSQNNPFIVQPNVQMMPSNPFVGQIPHYPLNSTNPFLPTFSTPVTVTHDIPVLKPKEVTLLKLSELIGISADNRLNTFFRQVETCTTSDDKRREVALTRVEPDIATFLTAELVQRGNNIPWSEMKGIMQKQFLGTTNILQAWQEVNTMVYYSDIPPSSFLNKLKCKISALQLKFPKEEIPTSDKFLKTKIYKGLNSHAQAKLVDFLAEHISLQTFMTYAEEEYYKALEMNNCNGNRVLPISNNGSSHSSTVVKGNHPVGIQNNEIEKLTKKLEELSKKIQSSNLKKLNSNKKYCAYCRVDDHSLTECPFHPPRGVCFDCLEPNKRRGHKGCPGPVNNNQQ